jgi:Thioredoxin domain-containing protein
MIALTFFICFSCICFANAATTDYVKPGMVTVIDLGATSCTPCKMMAPVLEKVKGDYAGKAAVIFIDVWKAPEVGKEFGIRAIPTQIFYNKKGIETQRHEGFLDEESMKGILDQLLLEK